MVTASVTSLDEILTQNLPKYASFSIPFGHTGCQLVYKKVLRKKVHSTLSMYYGFTKNMSDAVMIQKKYYSKHFTKIKTQSVQRVALNLGHRLKRTRKNGK